MFKMHVCACHSSCTCIAYWHCQAVVRHPVYHDAMRSLGSSFAKVVASITACVAFPPGTMHYSAPQGPSPGSQLAQLSESVPPMAFHRVGPAPKLPKGVRGHFIPKGPAVVDIFDGMKVRELKKLEAQCQKFAEKLGRDMDCLECSTLHDLLEKLKEADPCPPPAASPWPMQAVVKPVHEGHRGYSELAARMQAPQLQLVHATGRISLGDIIGPYYSIVMPADTYDGLLATARDDEYFRYAANVDLREEPGLEDLGPEANIMFDASCMSGTWNAMAHALDYRCISPGGVRCPAKDFPGGAKCYVCGVC